MNKQPMETRMKTEIGIAPGFQAEIDSTLRYMQMADLDEVAIEGKPGMYIVSQEKCDQTVALGAVAIKSLQSNGKIVWLIQK